jgi:hypothetical protein
VRAYRLRSSSGWINSMREPSGRLQRATRIARSVGSPSTNAVMFVASDEYPLHGPTP